ncbi:MAG TPA: alpha/beta hydrolase [Alphaproteobacteria bacterium]|nr:alpha/beta hydrolase [Alphaproteobacteria bacterium]
MTEEIADPASYLAGLEEGARIIRAPMPHGGHMVWHQWGHGPPVFLMHGSFGAWTHWIKNINALVEAGYRVIAGDTPGLGDSDPPPEGWDIHSIGALVGGAIEHALEPDERFHLVGFSFGGIVGGQAVQLLEQRCEGFVVVGSNALGVRLNEARPDLRKMRSSMAPHEMKAVHRHNLGVVMFGDHGRIDELALHIQQRNTRKARIRSGVIPRGDSLRKVLKSISVPVTGIFGEKDATAGPYMNDRREVFAALPHCRGFHVVKGAGHWAPYERPELVNPVLQDALA